VIEGLDAYQASPFSAKIFRSLYPHLIKEGHLTSPLQRLPLRMKLELIEWLLQRSEEIKVTLRRDCEYDMLLMQFDARYAVFVYHEEVGIDLGGITRDVIGRLGQAYKQAQPKSEREWQLLAKLISTALCKNLVFNYSPTLLELKLLKEEPILLADIQESNPE
jgi:hypothetical protein